jgi:hypothetical protein
MQYLTHFAQFCPEVSELQHDITAYKLTLFRDEYGTLNMFLDFGVDLTVIAAIKPVPRFNIHVGYCFPLLSCFVILISFNSLLSNLDSVKLHELFLCSPGVLLYCTGGCMYRTSLRTANHEEGFVSLPSDMRYMCICLFLCSYNQPFKY